jgi:hypothetical protein
MVHKPYESPSENSAQQQSDKREDQHQSGAEIPPFTSPSNNGQHALQTNSGGPAQDGGFDLDSLRLSQNFGSIIGVQKLLTTVPVRRPHRQEFIRVHPDELWRVQTAVLEVKEDRETYLVDRSLWSELTGEIVPKIP